MAGRRGRWEWGEEKMGGRRTRRVPISCNTSTTSRAAVCFLSEVGMSCGGGIVAVLSP